MNLPPHLQKYQTRDIGQTLSQNLGTAAPPYVSIAGNRFTLIDAAGNEMPVPTFDPAIGVYLDACIIDSGDHISRTFYATKYDPSAAIFNPPDCWSDNGVGPSVSATHPQSPTCAACPNAVWGSATSAQGKAIPACQMVQKVALLVPSFPQSIFLLRVPPNSHKHLRAYQETCKGSGVMIANVITRIHFDLTTQGTLLFKGVNYIDEAVAQLRQAAWDEKKTDALVGRTDVVRPSGALAAPAVQQIAVQPTAQPPAGQQFLESHPGVTGPAPFPAAPPVAIPSAPITSSVSAAPAATEAPRRRRRTQAEMAAQNGAASPQPAAPAVQTAPQAPFPHPPTPGGFGATSPGAPAGPAASFGIAQGTPAGADPAVAGMLDSFFGKQ